MLRSNLGAINRGVVSRLGSRTQLVRQFSRSSMALQAQVFRMPAMSPTMTEGGVVSWKFKAGDNFSAGDVLLEVETDKATIDVEAQDDGIMWEIIINDGATGVPVGKPIALLAEPGDDLSSLKKPDLEAEDASKGPEPAKEEPKPAAAAAKTESKPSPVSESKPSAGSDSVFVTANPEQQLLPSVELLLHQNHISTEDAYSKIPASGPKGRILKGDVLAYLGTIDKESVSKVSKYIKSKEHLDLSNIIVKQPEAAKPEAAAAAAAEPPKPKNLITVKFTSDLHEITQNEFKVNLQQAINSSIKFTYGSKFPQYSQSPTAFGGESLDDIFDDLLAAPVTKDRFQVVDITYNFHSVVGAGAVADPFDELLGLTSAAPVKGPATAVDVEFKIKYNDKLTDAKQFVELFQDSLLSQIPSNKLIITN